MNISSIPAIDAAIGPFFFYFLLSLVCSAVNELIASALNWRGKTLEQGLRKLLLAKEPETGDEEEKKAAAEVHLEAFLGHHRVERLFSPRGRRPSYMSSRTFALTVLDTLAPPADAKDSRDVLTAVEEKAKALDGPIGDFLESVVADARGDVEKLRSSLENGFDEVMDRASGWYKRKVQIALLVIALVVALLANADTFAVGDRLLRDDALRAAVVAKATARSEAQGDARPSIDEIAGRVDNVKDLGLPLGWSKENRPKEFWRGLWKLLGLLLTVAALSLGAPFWFDLIGKVANVRGVGDREDGAAPDRDDPSGVRARAVA